MAAKRMRDNDVARKQPGKRRRGDGEDAGFAEVDPEQQAASLKAYMYHAIKLLHKALKKSRTFEQQKLVRKIKQAREPKDGTVAEPAAVIADLETQLAALKSINIDLIPPYFLTHRLSKLAFIPAPVLATTLSAVPTPTQPSKDELDPKSTAGKARNRVLAHKAVKEAWDEIRRAVAKRMGEEVETRSPTVPASVESAAAVVASGSSASKTANEAVPTGEKRLSKRAERAKKAADKALLPKPAIKMDPGRLAALDAMEDGTDGDSEASEGEHGDEASVVDDDDEVQRELERLGGAGSDSEADSGGDWSGSDEDQEDSDEESVASDTISSTLPTKSKRDSKPPIDKRKTARALPTHKPVTSSAFLPSLAGGYISYSDSDGEDAKWVKEAEKGEKKSDKERKNRRGQRARQAIWEKKYGSGANHIAKVSGTKPAEPKGGKAAKSKKKQQQAESIAPPAFNPAHAPGGSANPNAVPVGQRKPSRPTITYKSQAPIVPVVAAKIAEVVPAARPAPVKTKVEEGMHPSWEAKRRAQEALANLAIAPKGKKITFD